MSSIPAKDWKSVWELLTCGIRDYVRKNGFTDVVLGLSGGMDSALVAALAVDALGKDHVHGVMMPSPWSSEGSITDSEALAANLGMETFAVPISPMMEAFEKALAPAFAGRERDVTEENIQSRIRGVIMMSFSNKFHWMLLATGNKSEVAPGIARCMGIPAAVWLPLPTCTRRKCTSSRNGSLSAKGCASFLRTSSIRRRRRSCVRARRIRILCPNTMCWIRSFMR